MAKPPNYWDKRALRRLSDAEKQGEAYSKRIQKIYDRANKNIQRDIENIYANYSKATGLDVQSLKTLLTKTQTQKQWDELKAKGLDQYVKGNYKARITRLEQLQAQIYAKAKEVYTQEQKTHTACYSDVLNDSYYKAIYDTQMGTGYDFAFSTLDDNLVKSVLSERWSGKNYSQRIWKNTDILAQSVSEIVGGALLSGQSIEKTSRQIRERFDVSKYYADRLVRTETNHFHNQADAMAYEEMGVEKYVFIAVLDSRTSEICQKYDNEVIDLKDKQEGVNFPPLHVNCRSTTRAYMGEEIEKTLQRRAKNPITGENEVIDNVSYREWAEQHGLLTNNGKNVTISAKNINSPINHKNTGKGNPNAIIHYGKPLNNQQKKILKKLPNFNSKVIVKKSSVSMTDLSALTAQTGVEFAMFTKGGKRLIVRGNSNSVNINVDVAKQLARQGYKWSGHTHPGIEDNSLLASYGDIEILKAFKQQQSVIPSHRHNGRPRDL